MPRVPTVLCFNGTCYTLHATRYTAETKEGRLGTRRRIKQESKQAIARRTRPGEEARASHYCDSIYFSRGNTFARRQRECLRRATFDERRKQVRLRRKRRPVQLSARSEAGESLGNSFDARPVHISFSAPSVWMDWRVGVWAGGRGLRVYEQ